MPRCDFSPCAVQAPSVPACLIRIGAGIAGHATSPSQAQSRQSPLLLHSRWTPPAPIWYSEDAGQAVPFPRRHGLWHAARRARKTRRGAVGTGRRACSASRPASSSRSTIFCSGQIASITLILRSLPLNMVRYACLLRFQPVCGTTGAMYMVFILFFFSRCKLRRFNRTC